MRLASLSPFGAESLDTQITDLSVADADKIIEAVSRHRVVVFRDQKAGDADLVGFLRILGGLMFTDGETPVTGAKDLNVVSNVGRTTPPRSVFHTDTSYLSRPPSFSAMREVLLPSAGGETHFSDQVKAVADLPGNIRQWLRGRTMMHQAKSPDGTILQAHHPVLRRHPVTGERSLFLSTPERCSLLSGVDETISARIVRMLYRHSTRAARLYRHKWRRGDIVLWDNRVTMHRADHDGVIGDRILHRGLVLGEVPVLA